MWSHPSNAFIGLGIGVIFLAAGAILRTQSWHVLTGAVLSVCAIYELPAESLSDYVPVLLAFILAVALTLIGVFRLLGDVDDPVEGSGDL